MFAADLSECTPLNPFWHLYQTLYKNCFSQTSRFWRLHYVPAAWIFVGAMICKRAWQVMGFGSFWRQTGWPCSKHKSSWNWNLVQPNLSLLGIPLCKSCWTAFDSWLEQPHVMATSECAEDLARVKESVLLAVSIAPQGILFLSQWHCVRILYCSLSLITSHPVQCRLSMRVADCATFWVCKCLQLIYLSALPLTLFDIYIRLYTKTVSVKRVCLGAITIYQRLEFLWALWFAREHDKWWGLGPFDDKQVGHVQSIRAVGIETWYSLIYPYLAFHCSKSAERHWLFVGANLCAGNPPNFQKIWPEQTETPHSSHGSNCTFCDLDGRKLLNQLTLGCSKGHGA